MTDIEKGDGVTKHEPTSDNDESFKMKTITDIKKINVIIRRILKSTL